MSVHLDSSVLRNSQVQSAPIHHAETVPLQGIASDRSTLLSLREHANAGVSFCGCFESLINWIKECFASCFGSRASQVVPQAIVPSPQPPTEIDRMQTVRRYIDQQFNTPGISYPSKVVVFIKYDDTIIAMHHDEVLSNDVERFKSNAMGEAERAHWNRLNGDGHEAQWLEVETCFFTNSSPDARAPIYEMTDVSNRINLSNGVIGNGFRSTSRMQPRITAEYLLHLTEGNRDRMPELGRFLLPAYVRNPTGAATT